MAMFETEVASIRDDGALPINPQLVILATQAADQASLLAVMVLAYTAMEKLMTHEDDALERSTTRSALGSLMRALNGEMESQVERLVSLTSVICTHVTDRTD
ncbi:hypothetical protein [Hydrogenophaga sp.]|uniref:hypothetical protein n=1 Tax=Hydrogenophaga sp. TaxID=1904254 RepID=UPI003F709439